MPLQFIFLSLIILQKDRERAVYGLKEQNLAKTYIKLIPLGPRDPDAIRLTNWKKPTDKDVNVICVLVNGKADKNQKSSGDFPTVLYEVISKRSSVVESSLTIDDLNKMLDELAENMGSRYISCYEPLKLDPCLTQGSSVEHIKARV